MSTLNGVPLLTSEATNQPPGDKRIEPPGIASSFWVFKLFVCGGTPRALKAYLNLKQLCDERLDSMYRIDIVDLVKNPELARDENIMACPTVVKETPGPKARMIGDLSKTEMVLSKFGLPTGSSIPKVGPARSISFYSW